MNKYIIKRIGLAFFAGVFSLIPTLNAAAIENEPNVNSEVNADLEEWSPAEDVKVYCTDSLKTLFPKVCNGTSTTPDSNKPSSSAISNDTYIDITMHAGEHGHFADGEHDESDDKSRTKTYYYADSFDDLTTPIAEDDGYVFAGWSLSEDATTVDVEGGDGVRARDIGTDLYAVWSNKAYVLYQIINGVWETASGDEYSAVLIEYNAGTNFISSPSGMAETPKPRENVYDFVGWNSKPYGVGTNYDDDTVISQYWTEIYSLWNYNANNVNSLAIDAEEEIEVGVAVPVRKFTAPNTGIYEIYTDGVEPDYSDEDNPFEPVAFIRIRDINDLGVAKEQYIDPSKGYSDVHTYLEMEEGDTYYIRFGEAEGSYLKFNIGVREATMLNITFDVNNDYAWFDVGGEKIDSVTLQIPKGDDIRYLRPLNLNADPTKVNFVHWSTEDEDPTDVHNYLIVNEDMTVYGDYTERVAITLDYNGGYHPYNHEIIETVGFNQADKFETPIDPVIDDPTKSFAGWARTADATVPDADIIEGSNASYELDGETLYAVYSDKVLTTFVVPEASGGYMMDDPSITTFESVRSVGHIFYGMVVIHPNKNVKHVGWVDQNGNDTIATSGIDGRYHITGDTTFTALLEYQMTSYGNGGYFTKGCGTMHCENSTLRASFDDMNDTFSYAEAEELVGIPISYDADKYFIGYATSPYATEPDVIDGETLLTDLGAIYTVWGDDTYYVDDSSDTAWEYGSEDGLRLVFKREHADDLTYDLFTGAHLDGSQLSEEDYTTERGSLILTIAPEYLENLSEGEHTVVAHFSGVNLAATFTVTEADDFIPVPDTGAWTNELTDNTNGTAMLSICITTSIIVSLIALFMTKRFGQKNGQN